MTDRYLYTTPISEQNQGTRRTSQRKRLSEQSSLTTDYGDVQETGSDPGGRPISGAIKGKYSELITRELSELAQASNYGALRFYTDNNNPRDDAYVTVENFDVNPANPRGNLDLYQYDGRLSVKGTRRSHWRSVSTQPVTLDNPFDAAETDYVALPTTATKVRWYDEKGQQLEPATVQNSLTGRFATHDRYSPDEPTFSNPTLIANVPYEEEGKIDARVWDDFGRAQLDSNNINSWQKVFATGHNFTGNARVENGLVRMELDENNETLTVEEWDSANSTYAVITQGTSDWVLSDYNFSRIAPTRVEGQCRFRNSSNGSLYSLGFEVNRASNRILWFVPKNEGTIPSGLDTKLSPTAEGWTYTTGAIQEIISRREVNP